MGRAGGYITIFFAAVFGAMLTGLVIEYLAGRGAGRVKALKAKALARVLPF